MPQETVLPDLPLFPLSRVLLPGGRLALQIFELRYLEMIGQCVRSGKPFGVVGLVDGREVQRPDGQDPAGYAAESLHTMGTLAVIEAHTHPRPGLIMLRARGTQRFRLERHERRRNGLWVGQARLLPPDALMTVPPDLKPMRERLQQVLEHLERRMPAPEARPVAAPYRLDDCGWVAHRWAELLPLPPPVTQSLLETDSPLLRLELVSDLLEELQSGQR